VWRVRKVVPEHPHRPDDVGAGSNEYTKLSTAIAAASRRAVPDRQVEFDHLPAYEAKPGLCQPSLSTVPTSTRAPSGLGLAAHEQQGARGLRPRPGHRPVGFCLQAAIFSKYHLAVPKTWAQFAPGGRGNLSQGQPEYGHVPTTLGYRYDAATLQGLTSQAGGQMFQQSGSSWKVELNNPYSQKVMAFLGPTDQGGSHPVESLGSPPTAKPLPRREFRFLPGGGVGPDVPGGFMVGAPVQQQLLMTNLPQWNASGKLYSYDFGGSSYVVTNQCPNGRPRRCRQVPRLALHQQGRHYPSVQGDGTLKPGQPGAGEAASSLPPAPGPLCPTSTRTLPSSRPNPTSSALFNVFSGQVRPGFVWSPLRRTTCRTSGPTL